MHLPASEVPDEVGFDGAEQELPFLRALAGEGNVVEQPFCLGRRKIGVRAQPRPRIDHLPVRARKLFAESGRAAALPYDRVVDGLTRKFVPEEHRLALVGDAERGDLFRGNAARAHCRAESAELRGEQVARVVLHPAGAGIDLRKFLLRGGDRPAVFVKEQRAGTGRPLVERRNVLLHVLPLIVSAPSSEGVLFQLAPAVRDETHAERERHDLRHARNDLVPEPGDAHALILCDRLQALFRNVLRGLCRKFPPQPLPLYVLDDVGAGRDAAGAERK